MPRHNCVEETGDICPRCETAAEDRKEGRSYSPTERDGMLEAAAREMVYGRWDS